MDIIEELNKEDILGDFEYELNKLCRSCIGTATEIKIKQQPLINLFEKIVWFCEKEKEKNKELSSSYDKLAKECNEENRRCMLLAAETEELKNADLTIVYLNGVYDGEKKVEDKIKSKIEELDNNISHIWVSTNYDENLVTEKQKQIEVLQSLLERKKK